MFESVAVLNVLADNSNQLITGLSNPDVLIGINGNETFQNGGLVQRSYKSGSIFKVRWIQNGITGNTISIGYGLSEILLDIPFPLDPFNLEIIPGRYQFTYSVEISTRIFNPVFSGLAQKLGIPLSLLTEIPQQTLQVLNGIDLSLSTEVSTLRQEILSIQSDVINTRILSYTHTQFSLSTVWVVNHGLNRSVSTTVSTPNGVEVLGTVIKNGDNNLNILFATAIDGTAYII